MSREMIRRMASNDLTAYAILMAGAYGVGWGGAGGLYRESGKRTWKLQSWGYIWNNGKENGNYNHGGDRE